MFYATPKPESGSGSDIEDVDTHIHLQMQTLSLFFSDLAPQNWSVATPDQWEEYIGVYRFTSSLP